MSVIECPGPCQTEWLCWIPLGEVEKYNFIFWINRALNDLKAGTHHDALHIEAEHYSWVQVTLFLLHISVFKFIYERLSLSLGTVLAAWPFSRDCAFWKSSQSIRLPVGVRLSCGSELLNDWLLSELLDGGGAAKTDSSMAKVLVEHVNQSSLWPCVKLHTSCAITRRTCECPSTRKCPPPINLLRVFCSNSIVSNMEMNSEWSLFFGFRFKMAAQWKLRNKKKSTSENHSQRNIRWRYQWYQHIWNIHW